MPGDSGFSERLSPLLGMAVRCRMAARLWGMAALLALAVLVLAACQSTLAPTLVPTPTLAPTLVPTPTLTPTLVPTATPTPISTPTPTPSPYEGYLAEEIPPCTPVAGSSVDPCGSRPTTMLVTQMWWLLTGLRIAFDIGEIETIEGSFRRDLTGIPPGMEQQLGAVGLNEFLYDFVTHIVARATFLPGTERCTSSAPFRRALYDEFLPPSTSSTLAAQCFADVRVNSYILGKGPPRLTVQTGSYIAIPEFLEYLTEGVEGEEGISEEEFIERMRDVMEYSIVYGDAQYHYETGSGLPTSISLTGGVRGKEVVLFLGPSINHATEAWQVFETWDVKRKGDGTVVAVHPHKEAWLMSDNYSSALHGPLLEMELPALRQEVAVGQRHSPTGSHGFPREPVRRSAGDANSAEYADDPNRIVVSVAELVRKRVDGPRKRIHVGYLERLLHNCCPQCVPRDRDLWRRRYGNHGHLHPRRRRVEAH